MEIDLTLLFMSGYEGVLNFFNDSILFAFIKFFLFIYVAVLVIDIVLLFWFRDVAGDLKTTMFGAKRPLVRRSTAIKRWESILARLESDNDSQYKAALLEADAFADELLKGMGYKGGNMRERLESIQSFQLESKEALEATHALRNRIIHEPDFQLSKEEVEESLDRYKAFFAEIELFD